MLEIEVYAMLIWTSSWILQIRQRGRTQQLCAQGVCGADRTPRMTHVDRTRERCGKSVVFTFNTQTSRLGFIETVPGADPMGLGASDKLVGDPKHRVGFVEESV